jgi:hypothetical protein
MWYVATEADLSKYDADENPDNDTIWTVSEDPERAGWNTDSGYHGYGLTKAQAQFLADAANEKIARDEAAGKVSSL